MQKQLFLVNHALAMWSTEDNKYVILRLPKVCHTDVLIDRHESYTFLCVIIKDYL